ncbi:MAG: hypothetical protein ACYC0E_12585 [Acidimicrobiales bacterium]
MIVEPPLEDGAFQTKLAWPSLAVATNPVGAPGTVRAFTITDVVAAAEGPPLSDTVWPVNTWVVEVPAESVSVTEAV